MISTIDILLQPPNSRILKKVKVRHLTNPNAIEICARLIREGEYSYDYDLNEDGYVDSTDYDIIYNKIYGKWDIWHTDDQTIDIRGMIRIKKYINGLTPVDTNYDLDADGAVTDFDLEILRRWLLLGKTERETFNDEI